MCGITFAQSKTNNINDLIKTLYHLQKTRGSEGFGYFGLTNRNRRKYQRSTTEKNIFEKMDKEKFRTLLFHHRTPTSTKNTEKSAHPFRLKYNNKIYYFVHNGIIHNSLELYNDHKKFEYESEKVVSTPDKEKKKDITYVVFNDSEALAWDFVLYINGKQNTLLSRGSIAFICIEYNKSTQEYNMYFFRNASSPLKILQKKGLLVLASEGNELEEIQANHLYSYSFKTRNIIHKATITGTDYSSCTTYPYWDYKSNNYRYPEYDTKGRKVVKGFDADDIYYNDYGDDDDEYKEDIARHTNPTDDEQNIYDPNYDYLIEYRQNEQSLIKLYRRIEENKEGKKFLNEKGKKAIQEKITLLEERNDEIFQYCY